MTDESLSASAAIRKLCETIQARLEQNEDFRALRALERALVEIAQIQRPTAPQKAGSTARETSAHASSITGLSENSLRFG